MARASRASSLCHQLAYEPIGGAWRRLRYLDPKLSIRQAKMNAARNAWRQRIYEWRKELEIAPEFADKLDRCRYANGFRLDYYPCHFRLCPFCYYNQAKKWLTMAPFLVGGKPLDVVVWQSRVDEIAVMDSVAAAQHRYMPCNFVRSAMLCPVREAKSDSLCVSQLYSTCVGEAVSFWHRITVLSVGLPKDYVAKVAECGGSVSVDFMSERRQRPPWEALASLGYCADWVKLPYSFASAVSSWNSGLRAVAVKV